MHYTSTRDNSITYTFEEALTSGYSPDGGLFVPKMNELPKPDLEKLSQIELYSDFAYELLRLFISESEIGNDDLLHIMKESFEYFDRNASGGAIPVKKITQQVFVSELFQGPTFCFKDLGMKFLINTLNYFCAKRKTKMTLVVSTTGDTGPAAVRAVSDLKKKKKKKGEEKDDCYLSILVHYPQGQISAFQRKQLTTIESENVKVVSFQGGGDDMDLPIKRMLSSSNSTSSSSSTERKLCGVNSYNIGRPLMQMCHYVWTYLRVVEQCEDKSIGSLVDFVMPTGAMGNITGGYIAKKMGIPIGFLSSGVNQNDITHRVMSTGKFVKNPKMFKTLSEAINIQVPYNFERLLYYLTNQNNSLVSQWMNQIEQNDPLDLNSPSSVDNDNKQSNTTWFMELKKDFQSASSSDDEMCEMMRKVLDIYEYYIDPHTAVAFCAAEKLGYPIFPSSTQKKKKKKKKDVPVAILATASPCKFQESFEVAFSSSSSSSSHQNDPWLDYQNHPTKQFPKDALEIMKKRDGIDEIPPIIYESKPGLSLEENQKLWEEQAKNIIGSFN